MPSDSNLTVSIANSAWLDQRYALQPAFLAALQQYYAAQAAPITTAEVRCCEGWLGDGQAPFGCISNPRAGSASLAFTASAHRSGCWQPFPACEHAFTARKGQVVNAWVANTTRGKISDIVDAATLREATLILVSRVRGGARRVQQPELTAHPCSQQGRSLSWSLCLCRLMRCTSRGTGRCRSASECIL